MITITLKTLLGSFAENKDIAREIRLSQLEPALKNGETVILDFSGIEGATQSFIHALISEPFRQYGEDTLERIRFKDCSPSIKKIITIVTEYMQEAE